MEKDEGCCLRLFYVSIQVLSGKIHAEAPVADLLAILFQHTLRKIPESVLLIEFTVFLGVGDEGKLPPALMLYIGDQAVLQHTAAQTAALHRIVHCQHLQIPGRGILFITVCPGIFRKVEEVENLGKPHRKDQAQSAGFDIILHISLFVCRVFDQCSRDNLPVLDTNKALVLLNIGLDVDAVQFFHIAAV